MKKNLLKTMLLLCALIAGSGTMWADEATFDWKDGGNMGSNATGKVGKINLTGAANSASGAPSVTSNTLRLYAHRSDGDGSSATFTADDGYKISAIEVSCPSGSSVLQYDTDNSGSFTAFEFSDGVATVSGLDISSITLKNCQNSGSKNTTIQISEVVITYAADGDTRTDCVTSLDLTTKSFALDSDGTLTATATEDAGLTGAVTYTFASADDDVLTVLSDGTYEAVAIGTTKVTVTATPAAGDASSYKPVEAEVNVKVTGTTTMTLSASSDTQTYGTPITFSVTGLAAGYDGVVTVSSGNTAVATASISSGTVTVTPVAVGTAVITVTAPATDLYLGSVERTFTAEFTQPAGGTTAKAAANDAVLFHESFGDNEYSARVWDDSYSVKTGVSAVYSGITGYTVSNVKQGKNTTGSTKSGLNQSSSDTDAYIIIGPLNVASYSDLKLAYQWKAGSTGATYTTSAYYKTSSGGDFTALTGTGPAAVASSFVARNYSLPAAAQVSTLYLKIVWKTSNSQGIIDELELTGDASPSESVTLNASGYATFCTQYPLDFTGYATNGFSAWQITDVSGETITFSEIKSTIKGGQGILLKGTAGATITIPSSDSSTNLGDNKLVGTLAPTYAADDTYYGLSGNVFKKVNAGTVPAGKALLPAGLVSSPASEFKFVFEDETSGISNLTQALSEGEGAIYDLQGRKVAEPKKSGLYIVNGKKVVIK